MELFHIFKEDTVHQWHVSRGIHYKFVPQTMFLDVDGEKVAYAIHVIGNMYPKTHVGVVHGVITSDPPDDNSKEYVSEGHHISDPALMHKVQQKLLERHQGVDYLSFWNGQEFIDAPFGNKPVDRV